MYASHLGWLHSIPRKAAECRINSLPEKSPSRIMPIIFDKHLCDMWGDIGHSNITCGGPESLRHIDINAFIMSTGYKLSPFAISAIKSMSDKYVLWYMKGASPNCTQPFIANSNTDEINKDIALRIKSMARSRRK